jgi:hypothetical protein
MTAGFVTASAAEPCLDVFLEQRKHGRNEAACRDQEQAGYTRKDLRGICRSKVSDIGAASRPDTQLTITP